MRERPKRQTIDRFLGKVWIRKVDECWPWLAGISNDGYGKFFINGKQTGAHRAAYELWVGTIPEGLELDHLCRNRSCVNPNHLEPVTKRENTRRGFSPWVENARKTHCPKGHEYNQRNTYSLPHKIDANRYCRMCKLEQTVSKRAEWKALGLNARGLPFGTPVSKPARHS